MAATTAALAPFHPLVASWFRSRFGEPTPVQAMAWERIASGAHILATAPTGSGKTLAAFLWAMDRLLTRRWDRGAVAVVYVSPLKALNNDVQRNLVEPLEQLRAHFAAHGEQPPEIRVLTRSGDTPQGERSRMLRKPPEILITTPESLNLLLSSHGGRRILGSVRSLILDEIHAVAASKRGTWLMAGVERLRLLSGEFQRIALSATVRPLDTIAELVGGQRDDGSPRPVEVLRAPGEKSIDLRTCRARGMEGMQASGDDFWPALAKEFKGIIAVNRSTVFFCNSRRMSEKLARFLNDGEAEPLAYAHHGSLSREMRSLVETRLKNGELKALVATSSLELGIDIGSLDEVVLVQCPRSLNACVQRVGRAGHQVGATSRGRIYPLHGRDLLEAAVLAPLAAAGEVEALVPVENPLDVLAQLLVAMCSVETWEIDRLHAFVRTLRAYRDLGRASFDLVVEMLLGRYSESRIRELTPRLRLVPGAGGRRAALEAREGAQRLVWQSGGVIPDRGYFTIRVQGSGARIGELDEEFVWERHSGDEFTIGSQTWRIARITHNDVEVVPGKRGGAMAPFWRAEAEDRDWSLGERIGNFLADVQDRLTDEDLPQRLGERHLLEEPAARALIDYLRRQREATGELPHRRLIVAERTPDPAGNDAELLILHAAWGGRVLRPLAIALAAAWSQRFGREPELMSTDDALMVQVPPGMTARQVFALVPASRVRALLLERLGGTGFFGARFRENAARALLLPRANPRERMPLWLTRLRAKKLLESVSGHPEFPILVETWRTCLQDAFDLDHLERMLAEVEDGEIAVKEVATASPSPFAEGLAWSAMNTHMYADDAPRGRVDGGGSLGDRALAQVLRTPALRPRLAREFVDTFQGKLQRTHPGYAPGSAQEILDLLEERVLVTPNEWLSLLEAATAEHRLRVDALLDGLAGQVIDIGLPGSRRRAVVHAASIPRLLRAWRVQAESLQASPLGERDGNIDVTALLATAPFLGDQLDGAGDGLLGGTDGVGDGIDDADGVLAQCLAEHLRFYGPVTQASIAFAWGMDQAELDRVIDELVEDGTLIRDAFLRGSDELQVCDAENYERLLRLARAAQRPTTRALPLDALPLFLADWQGLTGRGSGIEALQAALEKLFGHAAPAAAWESDIFPARLHPYLASWLDSLLQTTDLLWFGQGRERVAFCFRDTLALFLPSPARDAGAPAASAGRAGSPDGEAELEVLLPDPDARYDFFAVQKQSALTSAELTTRLWDLAWRGRVANDSFAAVRQGAIHGFKAQPLGGLSAPRTGLRGWQSTRPLHGAWHRLRVEDAADGLEELERDKDRIRQLLERYGVLFREMLADEPPTLGWGRLLPAMRLMELSGEILAGNFVSGIVGLQFASPTAARRLAADLPEDAVWWMSAIDPASCCGRGIEGLKDILPSRVPSTHLIHHGRQVVVVSRRGGRQLDIRVPPDHQQLGRYLAPFAEWVAYPGAGSRSGAGKPIAVEEINAQPALTSPYGAALQDAGFTREMKHWVLRRAYS